MLAAPTVTGWRGFHSELRRAAMAATESGAPLALLILELAGLPRIRARHGPTAAGALVRALAGLLEAELGAPGALARYADDRLCIILPRTDLAAALARAERIGRILTLERAGADARIDLDLEPALGVAQFADDEALGQLIERALQALARARAAGRLAEAATGRSRRRPSGAQ
jgi:diguanylate cyclase (GGDEF)-like protein